MSVDFRPLVPPTDEELMQLHGLNPGYTVERHADGTLLLSPNGFWGSGRSGEVRLLMRQWQDAGGSGGFITDSSGGYRLPSSAVYAPDAAYVSAERVARLSKAERETYFPGAPDVAFEVVSESDTRSAQRKKCEEYVQAGCAIVVLVDPYRRSVDFWRDGICEDIPEPFIIDCSPVMPGFLLDATVLFDL